MTIETASLPSVPRFNAWREWKPIVANLDLNEWHRLQVELRDLTGPELQAIYSYCRHTGFECVEFVILATYADVATFRRYPGGLLVVPCEDVLEAAAGTSPVVVPRNEHLYDAWLPLRETTPSAVQDAIAQIDETVTLIARSYGVSARWLPKYIETVRQGAGVRTIDDSDWEDHSKALGRWASLPTSIRPAAARAAHWLLRGENQRAGIDKFLFTWFALEGLLLALYDSASDIELPIDDGEAGKTRAARRRLREDRIRSILAASLESDATQAVMNAYFQGVVPIRRRCEAVLRALLGDQEPRVAWLYGDRAGPGQLRTEIVHNGASAHEIYGRFPIDRTVEQLQQLANEVLVRALRRSWRGEPLPTVARSYTMMMGNGIVNAPTGGWAAEGDFRITHGRLAALGLL